MGESAAIPAFREDGYLPPGLYVATPAEVTFRFGSANRQRRRLAIRVRRWIDLALAVGAPRMFVDGSFVTAKAEPNDVDGVILLPPDFVTQIERELTPAIELHEMILTRRPEELFAAEDDHDWDAWVEFFSRTREADGRRKGLVEIEL
jgi:hypothetical protein